MPDPSAERNQAPFTKKHKAGVSLLQATPSTAPSPGGEHVLYSLTRVHSEVSHILHGAVRAWGTGKAVWKAQCRPQEEELWKRAPLQRPSWFPATGNLWVLCSMSTEGRKVQSEQGAPTSPAHLSYPRPGQEEATVGQGRPSFPLTTGRVARDHPEGPFWLTLESKCGFHSLERQHKEDCSKASRPQQGQATWTRPSQLGGSGNLGKPSPPSTCQPRT